MNSKEKYLLGKEYYNNGKSINEICIDLKISRSRFSDYLKKCGVEVSLRPHKIHSNVNIFNCIDSEDKAYWLGFLYADGCIASNRNTVEIALSIEDIEHLYKFKKFMDSEHPITTRHMKLGEACRIAIRDDVLKNDLVNLGCVPKKSHILKFPTYKQIPKEMINHFIRGYFDGDGSIVNTEKTREINIIGTYDLLNGICEEIGISNDRIYKLNKNAKTIFRIVCSGKNDIINILNYMYKDSNIYLDRKHNKYLDLINYYCPSNSTTVEELEV